jgi:hypothetical protein
MMIAAVDQGDANGLVLQPPHCRQSGETATDDEEMGSLIVAHW